MPSIKSESALAVQDQIAAVAQRKATTQAHPGQDTSVSATKLAKNKRLPATMITPGGKVETSKKKSALRSQSSKKKKASAAGKEKAIERLERLQVRVRQGEDKKAKRARAKNAWE